MSLTADQVMSAYTSAEAEGRVYPTGFPWLDGALRGGLRRGQVLVIGALDNVGKSRVCLASAIYRAKHHCQESLYISLEDGSEEVGRRLAKAQREFEGGLCLTHYAFPIPTIEDTCEQIKKAPEGTSVVYVDYIQELGDAEHSIIGRNLRCLQQAAYEAGCGLVVASQCTEKRDKEGRLQLPPTRGWLRGSRALSIKPHAVVMLWRESGDDDVHAVLDKNKSGRVGVRAILEPCCGGVLLSPGTEQTTEVPEW